MYDVNTGNEYSLIEWQNIYYMLCYAVDEVSYMQHFNVSYDDVNTTADLFGKLLNETFAIVYNEQILRQYIMQNYDTNRPRGRLNIEKSYRTGSIGKGQINCDVLKFDIDNRYNQAIKAGFLSLLNFGPNLLSLDIHMKLSQNLELLSSVTSKMLTLDLIGDGSDIPIWYKPVRFVLLLIYYHHMASDKDGDNPLYALSDRDRLCWIFEKFVRNYCYYQYRNITGVWVSQPHYWEKRQRNHDRKCELDLLLESRDSALVIDMKWYENPYLRGCAKHMRQVKEYMQGYQQKLYQHKRDETYKDMDHTNGLLLYADTTTGEDAWEDSHFGSVENVSQIHWQTIGLKQDWDKILSDLDMILLGHLGVSLDAPDDDSNDVVESVVPKSTTKKVLFVEGVPCEYVKLDERVEFVCNRCRRKKIARKYAQYTVNGVTKKLCNGCYGNLLSKQTDAALRMQAGLTADEPNFLEQDDEE